jgi:hypothetical protein
MREACSTRTDVADLVEETRPNTSEERDGALSLLNQGEAAEREVDRLASDLHRGEGAKRGQM